jgi:hypothetical protein
MAEYLFRMKLEQAHLHDSYTTCSRSLTTDYEPEDSPASPQGVEVIYFHLFIAGYCWLKSFHNFCLQVLRDIYKLDATPHRSKLLKKEDIDQAFMIIPVKRDLGTHIVGSYPEASGKIRFLSKDIPDPWHQPVHVFEDCASNIDRMLDELVQALVYSKNHK